MFSENSLSFPDSARFPRPSTVKNGYLIKQETAQHVTTNEPGQSIVGQMTNKNPNFPNPKVPRDKPDTEKSIHMYSVSSNAAYLPIPAPPSRGKCETTEDVFNKLQKIVIGEKKPQKQEYMKILGLAIASELPRIASLENGPKFPPFNVSVDTSINTMKSSEISSAEIPVFELEKLNYKDPISLVEAFAEEGKKFGAIKLKMTDAYINDHRCRLNPDSFTFKANRVLNNPENNEIYHRLRFYNELFEFHTRETNENLMVNDEESTLSPVPDIYSKSPSTTATPEAASRGFMKMQESPAQNFHGPKDGDNFEKESAIFPEPTRPAAAKLKLPLFLAKLPMMDKRPLDLFDLFRYVIRRGGYMEVINRKLWAQVGRELGYKGKITSSLSSSLKLSYAKILYPLELFLKENLLHLTGDNDTFSCGYTPSNEAQFYGPHPASEQFSSNGVSTMTYSESNGFPKRSLAPLLSETRKKQKSNNLAPLILGSASEFRRSVHLKASKGFLINEPHLIDVKTPLVISVKDANPAPETCLKPEILVSPTGALAQINNYLKWLACFLAVMQDSSRLEVSSKLSTTCSLRQFMEKDAKFQEFILKRFREVFGDTNWASPEEMETVFWQYLWDSPLEYRRVENCCKIKGSNAEGGVHYVGDDFAAHKHALYAVHADSSFPEMANSTQNSAGIPFRAAILESLTNASQSISSNLNPFELSNIPFLPDSLLGAYTALDLGNNDAFNPTLSIGMTFSTENWRCEDHFMQLCSYLSAGKCKRWYFIPELQFEAFQDLLHETVLKHSGEGARINKNYDTKCWNADALVQYMHTDDEATPTQYECIYNSLENIVSPYPETRARNDNPVFQKLIDMQKKLFAFNQEYLITPEMLRRRGITFSTTLQNPGEMIFTYPKTYAVSVSFGFNVSEETNFASKLWLDYCIEGEKWLQKQGILPNMLVFKLLINIAQLLESSSTTKNYFSPGVHTRVLQLYLAMRDEELALRHAVRSKLKLKLKEIIIEERNMPDSDTVTDDDLLCAVPLKIVIFSAETHLSLAVSLVNFMKYLDNEQNNGVLHIIEDLTFAHLVKDPKFHVELHLFYSDEKLRIFQRSLSGYLVDYDSWMAQYDAMMNSKDDMVLKNYKGLLQEGQKIYAALSGAPDIFKRFCFRSSLAPETHGEVEKVESFKRQVENLKAFVEESSAVVEQCHVILSLKHQQRIRNGAADTVDNSDEEHPESLQMLVELANKIPHLNFHAPEFELILEYKTEISNFDKACRQLIAQGTTSIPEIDDMVNLGTSFGIQIPSLDFLIHLKNRLLWIETHDLIVSGGDPFSGKKEIFSLLDLEIFRNRGLDVLAKGDTPLLETIEQYLKDGRAYDEDTRFYIARSKVLNTVDLRELEFRIVDMEDRSKMKGRQRLFVELATYHKLIDLKTQEKRIMFLQSFASQSPGLFEIRLRLLDLASSSYAYNDGNVREKANLAEQWLIKAEAVLGSVTVFLRTGETHAHAKAVCRSELLAHAYALADRTRTSLGDDTVDLFKHSSLFLYVHDLPDDFVGHTPIRYCICRDYEEGTMIECDSCHEWFHVTCVRDISQIGEQDDDLYMCPCCHELKSFQATSQCPSFPNKLTDESVLDLIREGDALQVMPVAELGALRDLYAVMENAEKWFLLPVTRTCLEAHGELYQLFLLRKFVGLPIIITSIVIFLLNALRLTDVALVCEQKKKPQIEVKDQDFEGVEGSKEGNDVEVEII